MVVVSMSLGTLTVLAVKRIVGCFHRQAAHVIDHVYDVVFIVVVPVVIFAINTMVVREVRRTSNSAAVNLSTSSDSAVPTVMLIATSLIYVLLTVPMAISWVFHERRDGAWCSELWNRPLHILVTVALYRVVFAHNFFIYVVTGKQFRSELRQLFCSSSSSAADVEDNNERAVAARIPRQVRTLVNLKQCLQCCKQV